MPSRSEYIVRRRADHPNLVNHSSIALVLIYSELMENSAGAEGRLFGSKPVAVRLIIAKRKVHRAKRKECSEVEVHLKRVYLRNDAICEGRKRTHFLSCIQPVARHNLQSFHIVVAVPQQSEYIQSRAAAAFEPRRLKTHWDSKWKLGCRRGFSTGLRRQGEACFTRCSGTLSGHVRPGKVGS